MCELLLLNGANINDVDEDGNTALHVATEHHHLNLLVYLLRRSIDISKKNNEGKAAVDIAVDKEYADCVTVLRLTIAAADELNGEDYATALDQLLLDFSNM